MALKLNFELPEKLYIKDPQSSDYGKRLLTCAIELINELGLEKFTFKKLGKVMNSSEVSIYRYFENKHLLLVYLNCWYWEWVAYLISMQTINLQDPDEKLKKTLHYMIYANNESTLTDYINESLLFKVIMKEGSKAYHISNVDQENKNGFFLPYKELISKIASIIEEVNPKFDYSYSLASTLFEVVNNQIYYAEHLPKLTSLKPPNLMKDLEIMINQFAFSILNNNTTSRNIH